MQEGYKDEIKLRLEKSLIYTTLKKKALEQDSKVIGLIDEAVSYAFQRTKTIIRHMGEFTLHDGDHLFRVLNLMEKLLTEQNIYSLSNPELMLLILVAFFHDIGMAPDEKDVIAWKKVWDITPSFIDQLEETQFNKFKRFYSARPDQQITLNQLLSSGRNSDADTLKAYLITEYIRQTHAERVRDIIAKDWNNKISYKDTDLTIEVAQICYGHNEDAIKLLSYDNSFLCGDGEIACLPLIGVILRLADILDFDGKRTPSILFSHLYVRHPVSIKEWNKHRAVEAWHITPDIIQYSAKCTHPVIESSIHSFCNTIDSELSACKNILAQISYNESRSSLLDIKFPFKVDRTKIETKKDIYNEPLYIYRETRFNLSKKQVIELLMGTKLYGNPQVALRELVQNSIDACLLRKAQEEKWNNLYIPEITIKYYNDGSDYILEIIDNGTGMDQYIIDTYYSQIGSSFYKSVDFYDLKSQSNADFMPTSRFGIGILSCFMVADTLIVDTRRVYAPHKSSDPISITVEGQESIFWIRKGQRELPGTTTKLILRKNQNPWALTNDQDFIKSVENTIPNPSFKININTSTICKTIDENSFKLSSASSLRDQTWDYNENIKTFEINFNNPEMGIIGSAIVAIVEQNSLPVPQVHLNTRHVAIEGNNYALTKILTYGSNSIASEAQSITVNDTGGINQYSYSNNLSESRSKISLHGIEIPTTVFPKPWEAKNNQVKISWPFPFLLVLDVFGSRDLDLNSHRTEIIMSDNWVSFEEDLAFIICNKIKEQVENQYWTQLINIFRIRGMNVSFQKGLERVLKTI